MEQQQTTKTVFNQKHRQVIQHLRPVPTALLRAHPNGLFNASLQACHNPRPSMPSGMQTCFKLTPSFAPLTSDYGVNSSII
jgi:hypothetical protein